jgi:DNA recombination protein RmuC
MTVPVIVLLCVLSAALAAVIAVLWIKSSERSKLSDAESRASAAEALSQELRNQIDSAESDFSELREKMTQVESQRIEATARLEENTRNIEEQKVLLEEAKTRLSDAFKSLAADALARNNKGFLTLAEEKFKALSDESKVDLDTRKKAVSDLVEPLNKALTEYRKEARDLEDKRLKEISTVGEQLRKVAESQTDLSKETGRLVNALKSPQVRGRWGEIALRKTAELAGMSKHCDFTEQDSVATEGGRLRPDMIVRLPAGREVVVDSKVSMVGYMEALEAETEELRGQALHRHSMQIKQHVTKLASKEYWNQFDRAPEFVVMFIPNDSFLAAAADQDPALIENALAQNVIIATPTTFIALLRAVAFGWRQEVIAESAQKISALGQELSDRVATLSTHLSDIGKHMNRSVESYNAAVASFETRLLSTARKFKELGADGKKEIAEVPPLDQFPRQMSLIAEESDSGSD